MSRITQNYAGHFASKRLSDGSVVFVKPLGKRGARISLSGHGRIGSSSWGMVDLKVWDYPTAEAAMKAFEAWDPATQPSPPQHA